MTARKNSRKPTAVKQSMMSPTALSYLAVAHDKACSPKHPNFVRVLKPKQRNAYEAIQRDATRAFEECREGGIAKVIMTTLRALRRDSLLYMTYIKDLCADAAFAAHMDCLQMARMVNPEDFDKGIDAMLEEHSLNLADIPLYDASDAERNPPREDYAGPDDRTIIAANEEDAADAINRIQTWLDLGLTGMDDDSRAYWGVEDAIPLAQKKVETWNASLGAVEVDYVRITDFDAYREHQDEQYKLKRARAPVVPEAEDLMEAAA